MREIAVYGKGGIGKSTISANFSAALSLCGRRVLQIGCDPKHDSTRLLVHGAKQTTVLDYMRVTGPLDYKLEDILTHGFGGVGCVEAGGPKPGVGCAGRGIISTFELLEQFKLKANYDHIVYDVLGDVVCGGFAVPIRKEYADTIFVVTSGEFMALYAANNILRGIRNYDNKKCRVAGIIYNKRNIEGEDERVRRFAAAVQLPICAEIPRSDAFTQSERAKMTVIEHNSHPEISKKFLELAEGLLKGLKLYPAHPLTDEELDNVVLGSYEAVSPLKITANKVATPEKGAVTCQNQPSGTEQIEESRYLSKNIIFSEPLHGCAFNGAMSTAAHIHDVVILAHAPKSCAYITYQTLSSTGRRGLFERGALLPVSMMPNLECTEMGETEVVFGGMEKLEQKVLAIKARSPRAIVVVSACPAGIIGDDIDQIRELSQPDMAIVTIKAHGNMAGDYLQGMLMCYTSLARQIIQPGVAVVPKTVNIVFEKIVVTNTEKNFHLINGFLKRMGVTVNCRFLCNTNYQALKNFCSAELNLLAYQDYTGKMLTDFFVREFDCSFFPLAFPVGYAETETWLQELAAFFHCPLVAEEIIRENEERYWQEVKALQPKLTGKKLMVITYNHELDWILQTAHDVGMEIVKIGVLNYSQDDGFRTRMKIPLPVEEKYSREKGIEEIKYYRPDVLLTNYASAATDIVPLADTIPMCPDSGFFSGINMARRWAQLLKLEKKGEWKNDEKLLDQFYA